MTGAQFEQLSMGDLTLKNRFIMASLTRNRNVIPGDIQVEYYKQRASAGLILTEGTLVCPQGTEWPEAPGLYDEDQIAAWKRITDVVHQEGGLIFAQIWHVGRVAHPLHQSGQLPPAPSAIKANGGKFRLLFGTPGYVKPKAIKDPKHYIDMFDAASKNAKRAGFDGVELHCANGYLPHQFLELCSNQRTDGYGGSVENRCRFALEIMDRFIQEWGAKRVGIKLSPGGGYNDMGDPIDEATKLYSHLIDKLNQRSIGYIQLARYMVDFDPTGRGNKIDVMQFRKQVTNSLFFLNGSIAPEEGEELVASKAVDAIVYGRAFLANPDLPHRVAQKAKLNAGDYHTFYGVGVLPSDDEKRKGYTDYPFLNQ